MYKGRTSGTGIYEVLGRKMPITRPIPIKIYHPDEFEEDSSVGDIWRDKVQAQHLENFNRGKKENQDQGEILWGAEFTDRPRFEYQQKVKGNAWTNPFSSGHSYPNDPYDSDNDDYYCNHSRHGGQSHRGNFQGTIITKWQLNTAAVLS